MAKFTTIWITFLFLVSSRCIKTEIVNISEEEQRRRHLIASQECEAQMKNNPYPTTGLFCNRTWDGVMCWSDTPAGDTGVSPCPDYINRFDTSEYATRTCLSNGEWKINTAKNKSWTNYTACVAAPHPNPTTSVPPIEDGVAEHIGNIVLIYNVGYGISLIFLVVAVFIMIYFRKLHCKRNIIHINLFLSFILRCAISFMVKNLVKGAGLPQDVYYDMYGRLKFKEDGTHWECKLLFTVFHYVLGANYMWVFVEGLYLYTLIFISVFSERTAFKWYILFGWVSPLTFVIPWVLVRIFEEDELCWNTHPTKEYYWIMKGPIVLSILVNLVFFILIVKALFTKLRTSSRLESRQFRYRRLAKSTLVLIPLFGVYYIVFICIPDYSHHKLELVKLYTESLLSSFQGLIVALLFCFSNGEVQSEVRKKWGFRFFPRRSNSGRSGTMSTVARGSTVMTAAGEDLPGARGVPTTLPDIDRCKTGTEGIEMMSRLNGDVKRLEKDSIPTNSVEVNGHVTNQGLAEARPLL